MPKNEKQIVESTLRDFEVKLVAWLAREYALLPMTDVRGLALLMAEVVGNNYTAAECIEYGLTLNVQ